MTHSILYEVHNSDPVKVKELLEKEEVSISKIEYIIDNISDSTMSVTKTEITQIVKESFKIFREYLFENKDFRMGWTYPKLVATPTTYLKIAIPNTKFLKEDRSFITEEQEKYFEANNQWKLKRREEWKMAKEKLNNFLEAEIDSYRKSIPDYSSEAICAMIVSLKFFKQNFDFQKELMIELADRRAKGDIFPFEDYIKKEFLALPKATLNFDNFADAFKEFKL